MEKKLDKSAKAGISDLSVLQVINDVQNCTLREMHDRLTFGRVGVTLLDLGRLRDRLVETGLIEKDGHFAHRLTEAGKTLVLAKQEPKKRKVLTLQPA